MDRWVIRKPPPSDAGASAAPAKRARTEPPTEGASVEPAPSKRPLRLRVVIVADTHNDFRIPDATAMPPGDVLVHCGDWDRSTALATWLRSVQGRDAPRERGGDADATGNPPPWRSGSHQPAQGATGYGYGRRRAHAGGGRARRYRCGRHARRSKAPGSGGEGARAGGGGGVGPVGPCGSRGIQTS